MNISRDKFEEFVAEAVELLPEAFRRYMDNIAIVVQRAPSREQLRKQDVPSGHTLFGLYEGVPRSERGNYGFAPPDQITIFQEPIQRASANEEELREQIRETVWHEIAHHFGMDEERVRRMEEERRRGEQGDEEGDRE